MATLLTIDETSGSANSDGGVTNNDTGAPLPTRFVDALTLEGAVAGPVTNVALSGGSTANTVGVDILSFGAGVTDIAFTNSTGGALAGLDSGLKTTSGLSIFLYTSSAGNNVVLGRVAVDPDGAGPLGYAASATGPIAFAAFLDTGSAVDTNATGAKLWLVQYQSLFQPDATNPNDIVYLAGKLNVSVNTLSNFSLANAPSGQNLFLMFGDGTPSLADATIIVTGKNPANQSTGASITTGDTVNTGQGGGTTTIGSNNQMIDPNEGMYFTFVKGAEPNYTVPNLDQNEADVEANIVFGSLYEARAASFAVVQLQPPKGATLLITAVRSAVDDKGTVSTADDTPWTGVNYVDHLNQNTAVDITSVTITRMVKVGNTLVETAYSFTQGVTPPTDNGGISVDFSGMTAKVAGIVSGDRVGYRTPTDHDRVLVENVGNANNANLNSAFDIGSFKLESGSLAVTPLADIAFVDDGPSASIVRTTDSITLDETLGAKAGDTNAATDDITATNTDPFGATYGTPIGALQGVDLVDTTASSGVDTPATTTVTLSIVNGNGTDSGLKTTAGTGIDLWLEANGTVTGRTGGASGTVAFAVKIDGDGKVALAQYAALQHGTTGTSYDEAVNLAGRLNAVVTVKDGDLDVATASVGIGAALIFQDDGPAVSANPGVQLDDETLTGGIAGGVGDVNPNTANTTGTLAHAFGSDGAGSVAYLTTGNPSGFSYEASSTGLLIKQGATTVMTLTLVAATGAYTVTQNAAVMHAAGSDENNAAFTVNYRVTDGDGDTIDGTLAIDVNDDSPVVNARSDLIYANASNPSPGGTGLFDYAIGADAHTGTLSATNSDFTGVALAGGTVGATAITNRSASWASESATTAVFNVGFDYISNPSTNTTTHATGTLTFDKVADTYAFALAAPIQSFSVLTTGNAQGFTGYHLGTSQPDSTQPDVSVAQLSSNFFVQFSGYSEPGGGTGTNNLRATGVGADNNAFVAGELFNQAGSWVSVSGSAAGVAGDTIQKGEVLDLDFFTANPFGDTALTPTSQTAGIFLKFDGIGSEDLVVVLKLIDASGDPATRTTKAFVVDNADILKNGSAIPAGYNISLDNNDGAVIFESNDFNAAGQNYVIEGAQVLVSTEGIAGSGINLNPATGTGGGSSGTQAFGVTTTDNDVIKISDIGFLTTQTPNTTLNFTVAVVDADGDATATQSLDVTIAAGSIFTAGADREAIQGRAGLADTFVFGSVASSPAGADHDVISGFASGLDHIDLSGIDANSVGGTTNDTFSYINTAAFGNVAGQLRYDPGTGTLQGDVNGDGVADFVVGLSGVGSVAASDLVL